MTIGIHGKQCYAIITAREDGLKQADTGPDIRVRKGNRVANNILDGSWFSLAKHLEN
jgi:hypothetical protein